MSSNKGKDGEHGALALFALMSLNDDRLEVMRHSETNVPDMGQDIFLTATNGWVQRLGSLANTGYQPPEKFVSLPVNAIRTVRIDVKTSKVIDKTIAQKATADIKKHPGIETHVIFGGRLTSAAAESLAQARRDYPTREIIHVPDSGIKAMAADVNQPVATFFPHLKEE